MTQSDGRADFDFLMGSWTVKHRRLRERLNGCTDWEEFEGTSTCQKILDGLGNVEEGHFYRDIGHLRGVALRLFDVKTQLWRIYWADGSSGILDVPMIGKFDGQRGEFYAQEMFGSQSIFSRFIWTIHNETTCRWEQAFSPDGGRTWETNWMMDFTRAKDTVIQSPSNDQTPSRGDDVSSDNPRFSGTGLVTITSTADRRGNGTTARGQYPNLAPLYHHAPRPRHTHPFRTWEERML